MKPHFFIPFLILLISPVLSHAQQKTPVCRKIFPDSNSNGIFDNSEKGIKGVCVST